MYFLRTNNFTTLLIPNNFQASVSQMIRKIMNDVEQSINDDDIGLVLQMHDEFILEIRQENATKIAQHVKTLMEFEVNGIHFPVKIRQGPNWDALETDS